MLEKIKTWLAKYNITTHAIALGFSSLTTVYITDPTFQAYINTTAMDIYHAMPAWLAKFVVGAVIPIFLVYRKRLTLSGHVGEVNKAIASNNAAIVVHSTGETHNAATVVLPSPPATVAVTAPADTGPTTPLTK